jgi:hypothetical protein
MFFSTDSTRLIARSYFVRDALEVLREEALRDLAAADHHHAVDVRVVAQHRSPGSSV